MENESEMIRQQMDETRTAMTDKIESLEHQVVDTVQAASTAVSETVGSVKEMVHDSLQTVKDSVHDTVDSVKDTFDLPSHVNRRPWTMVAGAVAVGYLGAYLLSGNKRTDARSEYLAPSVRARIGGSRNGAPKGREAAASDTAAAADKSTWASQLGDKFHDEISQLEVLAVGTLLGIVRDIVTEVVPENMEHQVEEIIDGITVKLGGKPLEGRILPESSRIAGFCKNGS